MHCCRRERGRGFCQGRGKRELPEQGRERGLPEQKEGGPLKQRRRERERVLPEQGGKRELPEQKEGGLLKQRGRERERVLLEQGEERELPEL